ncbi:hypothetical protein V6N13_104974 [Hibiscus sabdariffa]
MVAEIDFSSNNFSGNIFPQISSCITLKMINFSHNSLEEQLPESLGDLKNLESLDISSNNIAGNVPMSLSKINLTFLNLSFNNFEGKIPSGGIFDSATYMSFLGNPRLCGAKSSRLPCPQKKHWFRSCTFWVIFTIVIAVSLLLPAVCCVNGIGHIKLMVSSRKNGRSRNPPTPEIMHNFPRITHKELSNATGGFNDQNLIGTGAGNGCEAIGNMGNSTANMLIGSIGYIAPGFDRQPFERSVSVSKLQG